MSVDCPRSRLPGTQSPLSMDSNRQRQSRSANGSENAADPRQTFSAASRLHEIRMPDGKAYTLPVAPLLAAFSKGIASLYRNSSSPTFSLTRSL